MGGGAEGVQLAEGTHVWVQHRGEWCSAEVEGTSGSSSVHLALHDRGESLREVPRSSVLLQEPASNAQAPDMVSLNYLHEPGVLHNVKSRFDIDEIYTYTGHILIAVNPFRDVSHLYGLERMHEFNEARMQAPQPHAYAVADEAFHRLFDSGANQSILVSGESGAGKTETVKLVMQYLAFKGGQSHGSDKPVEQQVLQSNPLLEAFGNAKTARNDNSSRFGKYVEVQLAPDGSIAGAGVCTYLLERSRVVQVTAPERNYHIFYQLLSGADERESESLRLRRPEDFRLLNQSGMYSLLGRDNASEFAKTKEAMRFVGFSDEQAHSALRIVAGVLHLGNITFSAGDENNNAELANRGAEEALHDCAEVLQVDTEQLRNALTTRRIITPEGEIDTNLSVEIAQSNRDALAKTMYSRLFDWIVSAINASIGATGAVAGTIGLLDIYGFESFDSNSFEQFNINHANEKLQQHFNEEVFKNEQREYKNEGIEWSYIDFIDNQDVLELIEQKKGGILALLDEACRLGSSTPRDFTQRVFQLNGEHPRMRQCRGSEQDFVISHYAGEVKYSADAFLEKNTDYVVAEHADLLVSSKDLLLSSLFAETQQQAGSTRSRMQFSSVGNRFKQQLQELMTELRRTDPHFIRCIKPNEDSRPDLFSSKFVLHQMKCGGVLEAVRISCAGYPSRKTFVDFINRYWVLNPDAVYKAESDRELCKHLCRSAGADLDYQVGFSKIFLRSRSVALLDSKRDEVRTSSTVTIQRLYRMHLARASFLRARDAALKIQTVRRGQIARRWALMQKEAIVTTIQRYWRGYHVRRKRNLESWSAIRVQIAWKRYRRQRRLAKASAASRITQTARVHLQRKHEAERAEAGRRAAIVIQCAWRQKNARNLLKRLWANERDAGMLRERNQQQQTQIARLQSENRQMHATLQGLKQKLHLKSDDDVLQQAESLASAHQQAAEKNEENGRLAKQMQSMQALLDRLRAELQVDDENSLEQAVHSLVEERGQRMRLMETLKERDAMLYEKQSEVDQLQQMRPESSGRSARRSRQSNGGSPATTKKLDYSEAAYMSSSIELAEKTRPPRLTQKDQDLLIQIFTEETCKSTGGLATSPACQVFRAAYECGILEDPNDSYFSQRLPKGIEEKRSKDEGDSSTLARLISHTAIFMSMTVQLAEKQTPSSGGLLDGFQRYVLAQKPSKDVGLKPLPQNYVVESLYNSLWDQLNDTLHAFMSLVLQDAIMAHCSTALEMPRQRKGHGKRPGTLATEKGAATADEPKPWGCLIEILHCYWEELDVNLVPRIVMEKFFRAVFMLINAQLLNGVCFTSARGYCDFSSLNNLSSGITKIVEWTKSRPSMEKSGVYNAREELEPLRQALQLMKLEDKQNVKVSTIDAKCPRLSAGQKRIICSKYKDDVAESPGFSPSVCEQLKQREGGTAHDMLSVEEKVEVPTWREFAAEQDLEALKKAMEPGEDDLCKPLRDSERFEFLKQPLGRGR